jgi:hypothetical protein
VADNVSVGGVNYSTDDVTTLNGATVAAGTSQTQRIKVQYGDDGIARDVSAAFPLPIIDLDGTASGTITATDAVVGTYNGLGAVLTGTPTANSYVAYQLTGAESGFTLRLSGTFGGGTVWMESSVDSTNGIDGGWTTNLVRQSGVDITFLDASITTAGIFRGVAGGYAYLRVRVTGATTPSIAVSIRASGGPSVTALVASLPAGANIIGKMGVDPAPSLTVGTGTGTTPATSGQIGRVVRVSANVAQATAATLIAAPAAGTRIYVTNISCGNEGATLTVARLFAGTLPAAAGAVAVVNDVWDFPMGASGGGAGMNFPPSAPWALPVATALSFAVTVATTWAISVSYYVAA